MPDPDRVCAIVVTHDRRELLRRCLGALAGQTAPPDHVLVIDNASTDGTGDMVRDEFPDAELVRLDHNAGGAGGFHEGMRRAHATGADWIWLMDDDTIASETALEELLRASTNAPDAVLLASKAVWTDGRLHPMNAPGPDRRSFDRLVTAAADALLPLRSATFVSLLVRRDAIDRHGLPHAHYFIWSDDIEYTARVTRTDAGYVVPASVVTHATGTPYTAVSSTGGRFYFHVRNTLYMLRSRSWALDEKLALLHALVTSTIAYMRENRFDATSRGVVVAGMRDGLRAAPSRPRSG
jgi:rhamnopyranosyl-N-acetylglucosaminyl-diphospho-decaprenol beta-1,3/1,4-galactofuranosyltransferase